MDIKINSNLTSSELKSLAKGQLLGRYGAAFSAEISVGAIFLLLSLLCQLITGSESLSGQIFAFLITLILNVFYGIFAVGLTRFYLNLVCRRPYRTADVFSGFSSHADRAIAVTAIVLGLQTLCFIPAFVFELLYIFLESSVWFLLFSICAVAGGILYVYIALTFSQVYYMMLDFPEYTVKKLLSSSRDVMKGHKARLFYIRVSLLPYYLAGICSCGIALIWVKPFTAVLMTDFYLDLMASQE